MGFFSGLAGGILGTVGQWMTNRRNEGLMRESWEREDTAVQRRVADLKAAGLSPVLAAGQGASSSAPIQLGNELGSGFDAAVGAMRADSDIRKTNAEIDVARQASRKIGKEADLLEATFQDRVDQAAEEYLVTLARRQIAGKQLRLADIEEKFQQWYNGDYPGEYVVDPSTGKPTKRHTPRGRESLARIGDAEASAAVRRAVAKMAGLTGLLPGQKSSFGVQVGKFGLSGSMDASVTAMLRQLLQRAFRTDGGTF